jgi:hypothetical protein
MKSPIVAVSLAVVLLGGGAIGFAFAQAVEDDEANKGAIRLADAPASVRAAVAQLTTDKNPKVYKETDAGGRTTFDVEYQADGKLHDAEISDSGAVLEISTKINGDALPAAAANAIATAFPKATIKAAEAKQVFFYEVVVTTEAGEREVVVAANGQIGDDDDDESEDDGDDSEDDDADEDEEDD